MRLGGLCVPHAVVTVESGQDIGSLAYLSDDMAW